jgi:hypothetical protein
MAYKDATPNERMLLWFEFKHLPMHMQETSKRFHDLAHLIVKDTSGPETTVALRKLLEAKDAAVRARMYEQIEPA